MVFSSLVFLFLFLPFVIISNYWLPPKNRNAFLFAANLIFYAWGEPVYVLLMLLSIVLNYVFGILLDNVAPTGKRKLILTLSIIFNLGMLCFFKYTMMFLDTLRIIPALKNLPFVKIALPIGISFYTFQAMSYVIDVYRRDSKSTVSFIDFGAYISLFPQLIAGPIVRYSDVERQLKKRRVSFEMFSNGIKLFVVGLSKKVLLANQFGLLWDTVSQNTAQYGAIGAWIGAFSYALQIYFDFGGYSDMARGLGKMLGFDFCINFSYPYISRNITEFWRRWHISLGTWFKDYLYIPFGGNRVSKGRLVFNILLVWALTGLWHGAGWNFLAWGLYYGVILLGEKMLWGNLLKKLPKAICHVYTLFIVVIGWIFFASQSFGDAFSYIGTMFSLKWTDITVFVPWTITFIVGILACTPLCTAILGTIKIKRKIGFFEVILCALGFVLCLAGLITKGYNPFIYFQF